MTDLNWIDLLRLVHPVLVVTFVFPLIGIVSAMAWQTRQRRLQTQGEGSKSRIPAGVGSEHVKYGKWLAGGVVGGSLLGLLHPSLKYITRNELLTKEPFQAYVVLAFFAVTAVALGLLYVAREAPWRYLFGGLTATGILVLGFQDAWLGRAPLFDATKYGAIFRRDFDWMVSHFYFGMVAAVLMVLSLATITEIYRDRSHTWRRAHSVLNAFALVVFLMQGFTGARDLLEIPLSWQEPTIYSCNFDRGSPLYKQCPPFENQP
ncbi:MAG: DUF4079 domain-containing protein [Pseudanabaenaceae cyanobacterium]